MEIKKMSYYVVEVSFNKNNPIHRAIAFHRINGVVELFGSYEGVLTKPVEQLTFFKVIEEISAMNEKDYENRFKLPANVE